MNILSKFKETAVSVLPVMAIVLFLGLTFVPLDKYLLARFIVGGLLLIIGLTIFLLGVDLGIQPMGERCGAELTKKRSLALLLFVAFVIGFIVTAAEPDIQVFGDQVRGIFPFVNKIAITFVIAAGVGLFIMLGLLRTVLKLSLKWTLFIAYTILFILSFFAPESFFGIAFDSGGATTGPMTVPFIMALGLGVSSVSKDDDNSFGLTGVCSIGPVMAVLIYAIILSLRLRSGDGTAVVSAGSNTAISAASESFAQIAAHVFRESLISIAPLFALFIIFQILLLKMTKRQVIRIIIGFIYAFIGLTIFLIGVNGGFSQAGAELGQKLGSLAVTRGGGWYVLLIITGLLLGAIIVCAEPAVWVLSEQVESVSGGTIKRKVLLIFLSVGTAIAIALSILRAVTGFNLKFIIIPGYIIAMVLMLFCPSLFSGIAFDSGGVASGPLTSTFVLSFTLGAAASGEGGNDSFGVIALVAMMPLLAIQLMGIIYKIKQGGRK
ncbi:Protein of unknown function [Treponema bryantii]|uniref:DUF1538 domain-containing protein n=1 Tax=Treponema bryantii TaxID=163 RepID=A0A1I3IA70_9SPIR|nr:DUF1538 domain-containing protein [Treponema bryantii]SFI44894.1 Protein of unknown function [Treponema bryantii]